MKKKFLFILFVFTQLLLYGQLQRITMDNYYESNILSLSPHLIDEFLEGNRPEKYSIQSVDDWITSTGVHLRWRHRVKKHTQIIRISAQYSKYWNNPVKDNGYLGISLRQYFNRQFDIAVYYYYYPELYVDHFRSVIDDSEYRAFTYGKNSYFTIWNLKLTSFLEVRYRFDLDQLFYNKYFTEYDATNITQNAETRWSLTKNIGLNAAYGYRISHARAEKAYKNTSITDYKDPSYTMNRYEIGFSIDNIIKNIDMKINLHYHEKYYDSKFPDNTYHYGRDEFYKRAQLSFSADISRYFRLEPSFEYQNRSVRSPFDSVVRDKEYENFKVGLQIRYSP